MTSSIKLENNQNKQQRFQQQHAAMVKNLHLAEVITTASTPQAHHNNNNNMNAHRHTTVDPVEMTKLLNNITTTTTSTNSSLKTNSISPTMDHSSRLNHFSWEEIEGRYLPVIYRYKYILKKAFSFTVIMHFNYTELLSFKSKWFILKKP
jgi:hypothetical protein